MLVAEMLVAERASDWGREGILLPAGRRQVVTGAGPFFKGCTLFRQDRSLAERTRPLPRGEGTAPSRFRDRSGRHHREKREGQGRPKVFEGGRGSFPAGKSPSPFWEIGQAALDYNRPS